MKRPKQVIFTRMAGVILAGKDPNDQRVALDMDRTTDVAIIDRTEYDAIISALDGMHERWRQLPSSWETTRQPDEVTRFTAAARDMVADWKPTNTENGGAGENGGLMVVPDGPRDTAAQTVLTRPEREALWVQFDGDLASGPGYAARKLTVAVEAAVLQKLRRDCGLSFSLPGLRT